VKVDCGDARCSCDGVVEHFFVNGVAELVGWEHVAEDGVALECDVGEAWCVVSAADADEDGDVWWCVLDDGEGVVEDAGDEVGGWLFVPLGFGAADFYEKGWYGQVWSVVGDFIADFVGELCLLDACGDEPEESCHGVWCGGDEGVGSSAEFGGLVVADGVDGEGGCACFASVS